MSSTWRWLLSGLQSRLPRATSLQGSPEPPVRASPAWYFRPAQPATDAVGDPSPQASGLAPPRRIDGHADLRASLDGLVWALQQVQVAQLDPAQAAHLRTAQVIARQLLDTLLDGAAIRWRADLQEPLRSKPAVTPDSEASGARHLPVWPAGSSPESGWVATDPDPRPHRLLRLLHADDSTEHRLLVRSFLRDTGWQVDEVRNGEEALSAWQRDRHDVVMLDWQMPVLDGLATARGIRTVEQRLGWSPVPIVTVTASSSPGAQIAARNAGADAHLDKPLAREQLLDVLTRVAALAAGAGLGTAGAASVPPSRDCLRVAACTAPFVLGFLNHLRSELDHAQAVQIDAQVRDLAHLAHDMAARADELGLDTLCVALSALEDAALSQDSSQLHAQLRALTALLADVRVEAF
jgi:CheY-like chemotaxis protein